ncbi:MAG: cupin domain-containing protein [Acidimicrobiales bacterium]|tara:strand:- start:206 stop:598 length:393 start_codon:yes stop_codon:yes gene_type:complete
MIQKPVNLNKALKSFSDTWSPRIVTKVNNYDVRIAHVEGEHVWHVHEETDEFFLVLKGRFDIATREGGEEKVVNMSEGDTYVVPRGTFHKPSSDGASILMFEPTGTNSTGDDYQGILPENVESTIGRLLD